MKSTSKFSRYRVAHELIPDAEPYFDLQNLAHEVVDGAWEDERYRTRERHQAERVGSASDFVSHLASAVCSICNTDAASSTDAVVWLRFEPFILHVCCRDLPAAANLIAAARVVFKNVGLQSWAEGKAMVAIWGDEGLEMALSDPQGRPLFKSHAAWLQDLVNSRHRRNWAKIDRFTEAVRAMPAESVVPAGMAMEPDEEEGDSQSSSSGPRHYDIVGDVIVLAAAPPEEDQAAIGEKLLAENRKARIVAARCGSLQTDHRKPVSMKIIAGQQRRPLITTHAEFGVRYVINLEALFFSARMGPERQRLCSQVQDGEKVFVPFAGCAPEVLQIADKTAVQAVVAVELNPDAVECARRSLALMERRDSARASRVQITEGDVCSAAASLTPGSFDRIVAPRPKGKSDEEDIDLAATFLKSLVPLLRPGGTCHWYDFVADWEFPTCSRSVARIHDACASLGRSCTILRCAAANSKPVAERQYRTVIDFSVV